MTGLFQYYVGVDLGKQQDFTAITILEEPVWVPSDEVWGLHSPHAGWVSPDQLVPEQVRRAWMNIFRWSRPAKPPIRVRHIERLPLGTPYPEVVARVRSIMTTAPISAYESVLIVDATGVGNPVVDSMRMEGLQPRAVTLTAGNAVNSTDDGYTLHVPKRDVIAAAQVLLQSERLRIAPSLPESETLTSELIAYQVKITDKAHEQFGQWRMGQHDDLVLALAIAAWFREWYSELYDRRLAEYDQEASEAAVAAARPRGGWSRWMN